MIDFCEVSDLPPAQCAHCKGVKPEPKKSLQDAPIGLVVQAKYEGFCFECRSTIDIGENIVKSEDGGWVHTGCL